MPLRPIRAFLVAATVLLPAALRAQAPEAPPPVDSLVVEGNHRLTSSQILGTAGIVLGQTVNYRDVQRAITKLFRTGQFDDVTVDQRESPSGKLVLAFVVRERPVLSHWAVRGVEKVGERAVKDRVSVPVGRPIDRAAVARSVASIDSLYRERGYYGAQVHAIELPQPNGDLRMVFDVREGNRVAISQVTIDGNAEFPDGEVVRQMRTRPEGFWWFETGEYDQDKLDADMRERLPAWYADHGFIDFQVTHDSLRVDSTAGKAALAVRVDEGDKYFVGTFDVAGNRRFSTDEVLAFYPFRDQRDSAAHAAPVRRAFDQGAWETATQNLRTLYNNNGYIYAQITPTQTRRILADGTHIVDLGWQIVEGQPATINRIDIVGNDVTHERVIREAIVLLPGELFSQEKFIRSYQNISNLGFFQQPLPEPKVEPVEGSPDVNLVFRVEEKRTGNVNFGASLGQGTGIGGFIGLEEPNLFGQGKRGRFQWQFGANINDFNLSYTDPAIRDSRVSGTISLFNSRLRYTVGDLGQRRQVGGSIQVGVPLFGSRYSRLFTTYTLSRNSFEGGSTDLQATFQCSHCTRSSLGVSAVRDTRIGLPFPTGGAYSSIGVEQDGGILGGTGDYQKFDLEGRWYTPLGSMGGHGQLGAGVQFVLGLTARSGFIFGDASAFPTDLYSMGGVQFGIPLRGYDEFSITPDGFDPSAAGSAASVNAFGKSYAAFTVEAGARLSQMVYLDAFFDAGNLYRTARQYDPTRLYRGAGVGAAIISPLGPVGIDLGYGFDRTDLNGNPAPGWKVHFKLGNFF
ncbi:MAG TPA: outer membrane protein assembly factor BamA [Gemmatimonadales bacterium]|nr:outer membrane protein assembly factor BamA [Gemmatimonadales bacterium]